MYYKALIVACFVACTVALQAGTVAHQFNQFVTKYGKSYATHEEYLSRMTVFGENLRIIDRLNRDDADVTYAVNRFADLTSDEFKTLYRLPKGVPTRHDAKREIAPREYSAVDLPENFDWRSKNMVTPVKNQGQCGSCWAFSTTEEIESAWLMAGNAMVILAPQQIVDCDTVDLGCDGGDTTTAYEYVIKAGGLDLESQYPYLAVDGTCKSTQPFAASITGWKYVVDFHNETQMAYALFNDGPISICVDASNWQFYSSGVFSRHCGQQLDHCVQLTGFGVDNSTGSPYWSVRNSWATDWGEEGYIRVLRGDNSCGVTDEATICWIEGPSDTGGSSSSGALFDENVESPFLGGGHAKQPTKNDREY